MYENGERVKGFAKKRIHKRRIKKQFLGHRLRYLEYKSYADYLANHHKVRQGRLDLPDQRYWRKVDTTDLRHYSKKYTSRRIRRRYSKAIQKAEYDRLIACHGAEYKKYFADWWWEL